MSDFTQIYGIIDEAIRSGESVSIKYKDYHGTVSERAITPIEWVGSGKVLAFCHLRNEERNFLITNILEITKNGSLQTSRKQIVTSLGQTMAATAVARPTPRSAPSEVKTSPKGKPFTGVSSADDWTNLLGYYRDCLVHEYQQKFSLEKWMLLSLPIDDDSIYGFLTGSHNLEYKLGGPQDRAREFFDASRRRNQQLCLGKSFVCINSQKISPLIFVPATIDQERSPNTILLKPEEYNLSYAALLSLGFEVEEIADFLDEYQLFIEGQPSIRDVERFVIQSISERLSQPLPVFSHTDSSLEKMGDYSIFDGAGFFWADSEFTGNLITELTTLARSDYWRNSPDIIRGMFDQLGEHTHAEAPDFIDDNRFYVTDINTQQRKAARAVSEHPVTIVTGPPGTGKSQLVINLIAQAYLDGKTVLFASHNNKAVDVVMNRLQGEIRFQGAIRTGSRPNRKRAVDQMESALAQIHEPSLKDFEKRYQDGKKILKETNETLDVIRDLKGEIQSYELEKAEVLEKLPVEKKEMFAALQLAFVEVDKKRINEFLSSVTDEFRGSIHEFDLLFDELKAVLLDREKQFPAIHLVREFEMQWGTFAEGIFQNNGVHSLSTLANRCLQLKQLLAAMTANGNLVQAKRDYADINTSIDRKSEALNDEQLNAALSMAEKVSDDRIKEERQHLLEHAGELRRLETHAFSLLEKIVITLRIINPRKKLAERLQARIATIQPGSLLLNAKTATVDDLRNVHNVLETITETALMLHEAQRRKEHLANAQTQIEIESMSISANTIGQFDRLDLRSFDAASLRDTLSGIEQKAGMVLTSLKKTLDQCYSFMVRNKEEIGTIASFRQYFNGNQDWDALGLSTDLSEQHSLAWSQMWQKIVVIWEANAVVLNSSKRLGSLPTESVALETYQKANISLFDLAGDLMRATWYSRSAQSTNARFEGTQKYISAVKQLNELDYGKEPTRYRTLKDAEQENFIHALSMFPVWAITNLTAKTNFPLQAGLFDLVIIDEASQCDVPSAIPLLYRGKKVVIIGDPNQLRHVATLTETLEKQMGQKYGVGLDAYAYTSLSLYDLGARRVGLHPGPILLDEHYRSDPRIITFSNEEFYGGQLKIKTDLSRRGFSRDFLNQRGGAFWINTKGEYKRPPKGSAYNPEELKSIQALVPQLLQSLDRGGYTNATVGVVTPFRAQETQIREWLDRIYPGDKRVRSGTAHQFQGDECDVVVFSPVLSAGIPEGTLNWLEETYNLLNVAITRARVGLFVVGDLDFCINDLPAKSRYSRLAGYIQERVKGVYSSLEDFFTPAVPGFEILGTLIDPSNPEFNRTNLLRFIASCRDYVYWMDPYFDQGIVDLFDELFKRDPRPAIKTFRMMTAERQVKFNMGKPPALRPESVERLKEQLQKMGVELDMRVLFYEEIPHDRFLYHPGGAINMPPFAGAYGKHRRVSEYTPSQTTVNDFNNYWDKGIPIENY